MSDETVPGMGSRNKWLLAFWVCFGLWLLCAGLLAREIWAQGYQIPMPGLKKDDQGIGVLTVKYTDPELLLSIDSLLIMRGSSMCDSHGVNTQGHANVTFELPDCQEVTVCMQDLAQMLFKQVLVQKVSHTLKTSNHRVIYTSKGGKLETP